MKMKKILTSAACFIMAIAFCFCAFSPDASAIVDKNGSITLHILDSDTKAPLEGASFRLYFFAAAYQKENDVGYDYVIPYENSKMDISSLQDAYFPIHLTHFVFSHSLPFTVKASDENGSVVFDNLAPGIYLIVPMGDLPDYFMPTPFVVNLPVFDEENRNWLYDINATPKMKIYGAESVEGTTYISVKKVWDTKSEHPDSVTVSLLRDFREVERITLSEDNGWHYRWDNLPMNYFWSVVENEVPDGYSVLYETSANTVTIINKKSSSENPSEPETETGAKPDNEPSSEPETEPTTESDELIDTGMLNWPVPVFSAAGLLLFGIGWAIFNFGKKEEDTV